MKYIDETTIPYECDEDDEGGEVFSNPRNGICHSDLTSVEGG